jgi:fumarylacetoacetase
MLRSFVDVKPESHFPIQNLPYGVFRPRSGGAPRIGTAIGEYVLDLSVLEEAGYLRHVHGYSTGQRVFNHASLNSFMSLGKKAWHEVRTDIQRLLSSDEPALRDNIGLRDEALVLQTDVELLLPVEIGDYTDFYASKEHASNVGTMFRGELNALMPNWLHLPVGYHGRASSIVPSGTDVRRPQGQMKLPDQLSPVFGPSRQLDFELEMGWFIGTGNSQGSVIPVERAEAHIFGMVLVNDWSARDIQAWEYQPLGPFLAKNFATSISPWVVPLEALEPFRVSGVIQEPAPLAYLNQRGDRSFDIRLEVYIQAENMEQRELIAVSNFRYLYWSIAQQTAHHTAGGCNLRTGDLLASGTVSGPDRTSRGCMLELAWRGTDPLQLTNGERRIWLEDGDRLTVTGYCQGEGYRIGFGEVTGRILPADR